MGEALTEVVAPDVVVLRGGRPLDLVERNGSAVALAWPGTGSRFRAMHRIVLEAGGATTELRHASEAVYFVAAGSAKVNVEPIACHSMIYVPRGVVYRFESDAGATIVGGPCPPDLSLYGHDGGDIPATDADGSLRIFDADSEGEPLPMIGKRVRLVVWPGVGADVATMNLAILEPGEANQPHAHADSDDVIAILEGAGTVDDLTNGVSYEFSAGDVVFVRAGVKHKVNADRGVWITSVGGPCPPDYGMLRALGLL
ncbi:MAG TPA: cupin domain-containing protein [Gaiellaceae bacterium]|nr:cupin domain-containing protein [Gaiellaceae bacterium]